MNNRFRSCKKPAAVLCSLFLLTSSAPGWAENTTADFTSPAFSAENRGSMIGEATKAVVGRVFGVRGEAGNIDYHVVELTDRSPRNAALRSFFLPGWGQHFNRQKVKGTVFFLSTAAAAAGGVRLYGKSKDSFDEYKARGERNSSLYDDYEDQRTQAFLLGGLVGILWFFSMADAYRNAYNPLYSKNLSVDLALRTDEGAVRINKKF